MGQLSYLVNKSNKLIKKNIELKNQITQLLLEKEKIITQTYRKTIFQNRYAGV